MFCSSNFFAQQKIRLQAEKNTDNSYSLYAENFGFNSYTVRVKFTTLDGYTSSINEYSLTTLLSGRTQIGKLEPIKNYPVYRYQYTYSYYIGTALRNMPDSNFVYLLPGTEGVEIGVLNKIQSVASLLGQKDKPVLHAAGFSFHLNDTVCAARAGVVYEANSVMQKGEKRNEIYSRERDKISVEQRDGTLATYTFTAPVKLLVAEGDKVMPGDPIAVFSNANDKYDLFFSVIYLDKKKLTDYFNANDESIMKLYHVSIPTKFYFDESKTDFVATTKAYKVQHPLSIITAEMTKKEKKKYNQ
jgi:hypothetical protein